MRPLEVVVSSPAFERGSSMGQRAEQGLIQKLVAKPAVEALNEATLLGLAWGDIVPAHTAILGPGEDGGGGQLGAVVADEASRLAAPDTEVSATKARHSRAVP